MCVDRDRHPAGRRRGQRAARRRRRWWWCSWWEAFDGPRGRRGSSAVDAGQPAADGGSSSPDADGAAEHAYRAAQHAEHAASRRSGRWRHGRHGPAPGAKLPAAERGIAATAKSLPPLAAECNRPAAACSSSAQYRVTSRARRDPPIGSGTHPWPGRASRRSRSPWGGRWDRRDAAFAGSDARSSWLRRRARLG